MKRFGLSLSLLFLPLILACPDGLEAGDRQVIEEIVARVNDEIITRSELERQRLELRRELQQQVSGQAFEEAYHDRELHLLRDMIDQLLLVQRGREMGLSVETDVIKRLDGIRAEMGLKSLEELERAVEAQGLSFEDFKSRIRSNILTNQVIQRMVTGRVFINRDEVEGYYETHKEEMQRPETYRLREILVGTERRTDEEARARVLEVLDKIRRGEKFEELAPQYSDAPTAAGGGELGEFELGQLAPDFQEAVSQLRVDAVSDALLTRHGYLLLQLAEHTPAGVPPLEKVENEIRERLYMQKVQPTLRELLGELRENAYVEVKSGYVDTGAVKQREPPTRKRGRRWKRLQKSRQQ
ncbi:MAG: peptidylprolyl isomerase [Acidobacteria bacterium]|nr:peptidylprolyl isomerase [Acidobacteriota bacterium]